MTEGIGRRLLAELLGTAALTAAVVAVGRGMQLGLEGAGVHRQGRGHQQRACKDAGGHLPAQGTEALGDLLIQVEGVGDQEPQAQAHQRQPPDRQPAEQAARARARGGVGVVFLAVVVREIVRIFVDIVSAGHAGSGCLSAGGGCENAARV